MSYQVSVHNQQEMLPIDESLLRRAVCLILEEEGLERAAVSVAVVDNATIQGLNVQFLEHDYPTDVLSFVLERESSRLEGEIVASAEMAREQACRYQWDGGDELLLYIVHGALHLVGYDDTSSQLAAQMRSREAHYLGRLGVAGGFSLAGEGGPHS